MNSIHYEIIPVNPSAHLFEVTLTIAKPDPNGQVVSLPAWIPGSYMIRDFAKNIVEIAASSDGKSVALTKLDKQSWRCAPCRGALTLRYSVYAWDLSVRSAHLDTTHGYFNGTSVFLRVHGQDHLPCSVEIVRPEGPFAEAWRVATTLPRDGAHKWEFGSYRAADYDELLDHPVEMGDFTLIEFTACGVPHAIALTGRHRADAERLAHDLQALCEYEIKFFGEPAPMQEYLFQVMVVDDGYGGLEHRSSTSLLCSRSDLPRKGDSEMSDGYRSFLGLCSHEYFHTWNVKRIKPAAFIPYDLSREVHTPLLWLFEGFTAYYDDLILRRCGLIDDQSYLELLGQNITRVLRGTGRLKQPLAESSFDAWTKYYKQDENAPNAIISYYTKGALVALALDLLIRRDSDGARSLDDVMRTLWQRHGLANRGVTEEGIEALINEIAGVDLGSFFNSVLRSTDELDLAPLFGAFGITYLLRHADAQSDKGGKAGKKKAPPAVLGMRSGEHSLGAKLLNVYEGGAAQLAGLSAGDIVIAVDELRATHGTLEATIAQRAAGDVVTLHAFRRDELMLFDVTLQTAPADTAFLTLDTAAEEQALQQRQRWLDGHSSATS
ncbi:MAG TPA: PDZ domain-containing protein [Gammaproteobacteria bacterium]